MAKEILGYIKLQIPAGSANPAPPVGPALGQKGLNIQDFCKQFNDATSKLEKGAPIPTVITAYKDRTFEFITKKPPVTFYLKKAANIKKGNGTPGKSLLGKVTMSQVREIAKEKLEDLNAYDIKEASKIIMGSARSMGLAERMLSAGSSKNRKKQIEGIDFDKIFSVEEGLKLIKERKFVKFDESIDVALNTTIDTKQSDQNVRGSFVPPHGLGKKVEIAVFASGKNAEEATALGVKHVGGDDLVTILEKNIDVDVIIATPDMMSTVSKMAKILGPKGMMPNPKTGTVTNDVKTTITNINKGLVAYKNDKAGTIHASIGRISFDDVKLSENITSFVEEVKKNKPTNVKGNYINSVYISSSMGIGIKVSV